VRLTYVVTRRLAESTVHAYALIIDLKTAVNGPIRSS
jgi:hypothetical protein